MRSGPASVLLAVSLLVTPVMLQATAPFLSPRCYCSSGIGCTNHTCTLSVNAMCRVDFDMTTRKIRRFCGGDFNPCISTSLVKEVCCDDHLCNKCLLPPELTYQECINATLPDGCPAKNCTEPETIAPPTRQSLNTWVIAVISLVLIATVGIAVSVFVVVFVCHKRRRKYQLSLVHVAPTPSEVGSCTAETITGLSSGGFTNPHSGRTLEARTMIKDIRFIELIASGGYSEVWRASYHGEPRAVKKFTRIGDTSHEKEHNIYQSGRLMHPNLVTVYGLDAEVLIYGNLTLHLIMEYYELGCLADYLKENTLSPRKVMKVLTSIASAVDFLHTPVQTYLDSFGGIAHRDLKTRNVMVQSENGNCVVGDFGLSLLSQDLKPDKPPVKVLVGTKRYMAPEVLSETITANELECFFAADIYSYGLIMWEVLRRTELDGHAFEYRVPYYNSLPDNPSIDEVRKVVVDQRRRPELEERFMDNEVFYQGIVSLMRQCWYASPDGRPTATRAKMSLDGIVVAYKLQT